MSPETLLFAGYAGLLLATAAILEWLSAHTHRRSLRWRTAGFDYDGVHDRWTCPEGQDLWPHEFDHERRLVRYRAKAHICNGCPRKADCTDSDTGREIVRPLDPWPHSEAGRFHRGLSLVLIGLAALVVVVEATRHRDGAELMLLLPLAMIIAGSARFLLHDFRRHPAGFPAPQPAHGLRMAVAPAPGAPRSRWASDNRNLDG